MGWKVHCDDAVRLQVFLCKAKDAFQHGIISAVVPTVLLHSCREDMKKRFLLLTMFAK